jgi:cyclopropane-fatty-acyl-phospholipid synthase
MGTTDNLLARTLDREGRGGLWRGFSVAEDRRRTNEHYEQPPRFFTAILGGPWHNYSCNLWESARNETESQEQKMDLLANLMQLQPGQRVLDVGCGWGGHLVYFAEKYGVSGVGLTLSRLQHGYAERRAREASVNVSIIERHWKEFEDADRFDAVFTDEVIVHFNDLEGYFRKVKSLLRPGGRMLNKEIHFASSSWMRVTPAMLFLNAIYGETGNYRTLHEELSILDRAGFDLERHQQILMRNGHRTVTQWLDNMQANRKELEELVGSEYYRKFRMYLRITRKIMAGPSMKLDVIVGVPHGQTDASRWESCAGR